MIDRRALWICLLAVAAMFAADFWRLSLLPDWHHVPAEGPGNARTMPVFAIFFGPTVLLFSLGLVFARRWLRSGTPEAVRHWRRSNGLVALSNAGMMSLLQGFMLARSLGLLQSIDRLAVARTCLVIAGLVFIAAGNTLPKAPWLKARFGALDSWQWNRHLRFSGRMMVAMGLLFAAVMPFMPVTLLRPVAITAALIMLVATQWHRASIKRQPSAQ